MDMSIGGKSWEGIKFQKYSNAKEYRLFINGHPLTAKDLMDNFKKAGERPELIHRINKLKAQCDGRTAQENHELKVEHRRLLDERDKTATHFTGNELRKILDVLDLLGKRLGEVKVETPRFDSAHRFVHPVPKKMSYR